MGFWLHKTIRILPGVHVTVGNGGVSYSVGPRNMRLTRHPGGRITSTVGSSRMGLAHSTTLREARSHRAAPAAAPPAFPPGPPAATPPTPYPPTPYPPTPYPPGPPASGPSASAPPTPYPPTPYPPGPPASASGPPTPYPSGPPSAGSPPPYPSGSPAAYAPGPPTAGPAAPFTPGPPAPWSADPPVPSGERDLLDALHTGRYAEVARAHGRADPTLRLLAATLDGLSTPDPVRARELLGWVAAHDTTAMHDHPFTTTHLAGRTWPVDIARGATAYLGIANDVVLLAVAELHQAAGDLDAAIWTVERADPTAPAALSLTELYSAAGRHADVVDLTNGTVNADDATALLLVFRGRALACLGDVHAGREALAEALRIPRASSVRHRALWERARLPGTHPADARRDLEAIRAEDPTFPGLDRALADPR